MNEKPRINVVQYMWGEENRSYEIVRKINERYCRRHGYRYVCDTRPPGRDRTCHWEKIPALIGAMDDCDYALFLDADAWFFGQEFRIEEILLHMLGDRDFLLAADCGSAATCWNPALPNTGVILVRNSEKSREMLREWNGLSDRSEYRHLRREKFHEQEALWRTLWRTDRERFALVEDYYLMNGFRGLFIRHQMATPDEGRLEILRRYGAMLRKRPWNWAIGMTTADRPRPTLGRSLESFRGTGFDAPTVFYDTEKRGGAWNVHRALSTLLETNPNADAFAVIEDDVVFARNIRMHLEKQLWPGDEENVCICSAFTPSWYLHDNERWWKSDQGELTYMSQFRIYHPAVARKLAEAMPKSDDFSSGRRQTDRIVARWAERNGVGIYFHSPSLAQHIGTGNASYPGRTGRNYRLGQSRDFVGEDFMCDERNLYEYEKRRTKRSSREAVDISTDRFTPVFAASLAEQLDRENCDLERLVLYFRGNEDLGDIEKGLDIVRMTGKVLCVVGRFSKGVKIDIKAAESLVDVIENEAGDA